MDTENDHELENMPHPSEIQNELTNLAYDDTSHQIKSQKQQKNHDGID